MDLKGRHFLTLKDFTPEEIIYLLDLAAELKEKKKKGILVDHHRGKNVALIFEKDSTRTRSSFEIAAHDLGMGTTYIGTMGSQFGKKESIKDTARVLGRMYDGIEFRGFEQSTVEALAKYSGIPVWNGLQRIRTGDCRRAGSVCGSTCMERIDKRVSSDTDAGRYADDP